MFRCTLPAMTTASPDLDLAELIADTEGEIVRLVRDRDPSTHGLYEMVRYHLALDGKGGNGGKRVRPLLGLLAYASIAGDHRNALPGAAAVELGHNFSLVHDDIEDGDRERRHRPTLWTVYGVPAGHQCRRHAVQPVAYRAASPDGARLFRRQGAPADAAVRRDLPRALRGPVHRYRHERVGRGDVGRRLLRHDRAQDRGVDRRVDRSRRAARHRRRGGHPRDTGPSAGRSASPSSSTTTCSGSGAPRRRPASRRRTSRTRRRRLPVIYAVEHAGPEDRERLTRAICARRPVRGAARRDRPDPGARRGTRLHARHRPPISRPGARRAGCGGRGRARRAGAPAGDHRRGDLGLRFTGRTRRPRAQTR